MNESKEHRCEEITGLLARWSDGELDDARSDEVRLHLLDCRACRARYGEKRTLARWIVPHDVRVPAGFGARVARLASEHAARTGGRALDVSALEARPTRPVAPTSSSVGAELVPAPRATGLGNARLAGAGPSSTRSLGAGERDGSLLGFVLACTAAAAAALLVLSLALADRGAPSGEELRAEPLPEVLRSLEALNEREATSTQRP
jgi:hypothetical protein